MKVVLDTNVFVSGVFFRGPPYQVLKAWRDGKIQILVSPAILEEYHRVMLELSARFPEIDPRSLVAFSGSSFGNCAPSEPSSSDTA